MNEPMLDVGAQFAASRALVGTHRDRVDAWTVATEFRRRSDRVPD
jgi:hypothetical protein